ncbi:unnamed protein product [Urochloa humidicola]
MEKGKKSRRKRERKKLAGRKKKGRQEVGVGTHVRQKNTEQLASQRSNQGNRVSKAKKLNQGSGRAAGTTCHAQMHSCPPAASRLRRCVVPLLGSVAWLPPPPPLACHGVAAEQRPLVERPSAVARRCVPNYRGR